MQVSLTLNKVMLSQRSTRQRLINAALELFTSQGVTETTTRQIAELAEVNEVTLFRQFGNKNGLLLAVIEESEVFSHLGKFLAQETSQTSDIHQALRDYASHWLQSLEQIPEFVRSVVGEAGQYPPENRQALGRGLTQANRYVAQYFETAIARGQVQTQIPVEKIASLFNGMLLAYAVIEFTSEYHELWNNRDDFLENLVELFLHGAVSLPSIATEVKELPANLVHSILQRAKKLGLRDYALLYVLFATGLSLEEIANLQRRHQICDAHQHILMVTQGLRQVPVNQHILGKRYGSYNRNPLTQWLKSRKDEQSALFLNNVGQPITEMDIQASWQACTEELLTPENQPPAIEQAQQTWYVEMIMRGIQLEELSILTGKDIRQLQPYAHRAREKLALEQALKLDQHVK